MIKYILIFLVLGLGSIQAQRFDTAEMDSLFQRIEDHRKGMGSISIYSNGEEIYRNSIGYSDLANKEKANAQTTYRIGSVSKTFTAALIMQLVEEGKLSLETRLSEYFPEVMNADSINLRQLLQHQSGIYDVTHRKDFLSWISKPQTREQMLARIKEGKPTFEPGEGTAYSNTNYMLLSYILEDVEENSYAAILETRILKPLNLTRTKMGQTIDPDQNEAFSYLPRPDGWELHQGTDLGVPLGAGGIVSTPKDLNIFFGSLFSGDVVSEASLTEMTTVKNHMGLGLVQFPLPGKLGYGHKGNIDGFGALAVHFPEENISLSYISNAIDASFEQLAFGMFNILFGNEAYILPDFKPSEYAQQLTPEELVPYLGTYSHPNNPLKIKITQKGNELIAQATGQGAFLLEGVEEHVFRSEKNQLNITFDPAEASMLMEQKGFPSWNMKKIPD